MLGTSLSLEPRGEKQARIVTPEGILEVLHSSLLAQGSVNFSCKVSDRRYFGLLWPHTVSVLIFTFVFYFYNSFKI